MIEIESRIEHCLGQVEAIDRVHRMVSSLSDRFPQQVHQVQLKLNDQRVDVSFAAYGYVVSWRAEIYDDQVSLIGQVPDSASKFKTKIEEAIVSRVEAALLPPAISRAA